jgi:hypothetical protein
MYECTKIYEVEIALLLSLTADDNVGSREGVNVNFGSVDIVVKARVSAGVDNDWTKHVIRQYRMRRSAYLISTHGTQVLGL